MSPNRFDPDTFDLTVEELLLKKNGKPKTANDVFELVVASHHEAKKRDALILSRVEDHLTKDARMTNEEFTRMIEGFSAKHARRDEIVQSLDKAVTRIERDMEHISENCTAIHQREPRRSTDTEDWGNSFGDKATGDWWQILFAYRFVRWVGYGILGTLCVVFGEEIATHIFHLK